MCFHRAYFGSSRTADHVGQVVQVIRELELRLYHGHRLDVLSIYAIAASVVIRVSVQKAARLTFPTVNTGILNVYGWGTFFGNEGAFGFLKRKNTKPSSKDALFQQTPVQVPEVKNVKELAAGVNHMLALTRDGNVYSWGSGQQAELGYRMVTRRRPDPLVPRLVSLPRRGITKIFAGYNHSFAIDNHGSVWSWGLNNFGQTGHGTSEDHLHIEIPQVVEGLEGYHVQSIAGGFHHSLACTAEGDVLAWGRCDDKQLGLDLDTLPKDNVLFDGRGRARVVLTPVKVPGLKAHSVAAGIDNSLAINEDGKVLAWGFSENYRTGLKTEDSVEKPTLLESKAMTGTRFTYIGCGGQFSVIAGPVAS